MSRLLLANEERDEALLRARQLIVLIGRCVLDRQDVEELLQGVCDAESVQDVQQFGSVLVQRLQMARQRRHDITAQEMKAVMEERDGSIAKVKRALHAGGFLSSPRRSPIPRSLSSSLRDYLPATAGTSGKYWKRGRRPRPVSLSFLCGVLFIELISGNYRLLKLTWTPHRRVVGLIPTDGANVKGT
uniref:Uncharacterized protein n=1 Tax=Labrus bergylta TaxID=56723 RepID=A0A3Q3E8D9_9LABR